jgi:transglutaminase-like putative cysteine protease
MNAAAAPAERDATPTRLAVTICLAALVGALLLNLQQLAWWCAPLALATILWRMRAAWQTHQLPGRARRVLLVLVLTIAVVASFRGLGGLAAGATLLAAMTTAKLVETRSARDWYIVSGSTLFLLVAACLDTQTLWRLPLYALEVWLLASALHALGSAREATRLPELLRASGHGLLLALPLALLLFLFFPRLPGAFWALPRDDAAITGLGEEMSPGSISRLSESDEPALRVRFAGSLPPPAERYWRGPVLHQFDGYTWRRRLGQEGRQEDLQFSGRGYRYDVTLEPNSHNVLIALELPRAPDVPFTFFTGDFQLVSPRPIGQARTYSLESFPAYRTTSPLSAQSRRVDLQLPQERNPRTRELAQSLRASVADDREFVNRVVNYFRNGRFEYTLTPPRLSLDSVDDFLFNTRQGFCGHFASAFVTLMRAGGVPARVVTGYLGGEWNPIGGYLTLRQSHAHAWAEVWLPERGWLRVDPTAVVAPERLTRDIYELLGSTARAPGRMLRRAPWIGDAVLAIEALNAWWQDSVIGFNSRKQLQFLESLGFIYGNWRWLPILIGAGSALWVGWIAWQLRERVRSLRPDAAGRLWRQLEARLARAGLPRAAHEGPLAYAARVAAARPAQAEQMQVIARLYAALRFGPELDDRGPELRRLRTAVRSFAVARR